MQILLVQHGAALSKDVSAKRPLTDQGRGNVQALGALLSEHSVTLERAIHSGKLRARQTAEILAEAIGARTTEEEGLAPNDPVEPWLSRLAATNTEHLLVGHQPFIGRLATRLLAARDEPPCVLFSPGSALCLERVGDTWAVRWMVGPRLLRGE